MRRIIAIAVKDIKIMLRTREALFWNIAFPIMMMLLFTAIFERGTQYNIEIGIIDQDQTQLSTLFTRALNSTNTTTLHVYKDNETLYKEITKHRINAYIIIPKGFGENITKGYQSKIQGYVDSSNPQIASIVDGLIKGYIEEFNKITREYYLKYMNNAPMNMTPDILAHIKAFGEPLKIDIKAIKGTERIGYKEYMLAGVIGYGFLFSAMASATSVIVNEKILKTIKRIRLTLTSPIEILLGKTLTLLINTYLYVLIVLAISLTLIKPSVTIPPIELFIIVTLGALSGIAIGLIISTIFKTSKGASGASVTLGIILQFLIGLYFPLEILPTFLRQISWFIPMTYATSLLRDVILYSQPLWRYINNLSILAIADIILYIIGATAYRYIIKREEL